MPMPRAAPGEAGVQDREPRSPTHGRAVSSGRMEVRQECPAVHCAIRPHLTVLSGHPLLAGIVICCERRHAIRDGSTRRMPQIASNVLCSRRVTPQAIGDNVGSPATDGTAAQASARLGRAWASTARASPAKFGRGRLGRRSLSSAPARYAPVAGGHSWMTLVAEPQLDAVGSLSPSTKHTLRPTLSPLKTFSQGRHVTAAPASPLPLYILPKYIPLIQA